MWRVVTALSRDREAHYCNIGLKQEVSVIPVGFKGRYLLSVHRVPLLYFSVVVREIWSNMSLVATLQHHTDEVSCCAFSASRLATSSGDKTIRVYDTADFSELPFSPLSGHGYGVHSCCFSACGAHLLSCSTDGLVLVWSSETGELTAKLEHPGRSPLRVCALAPDSSLLLAGACDGTVALWDFCSRTLRRYKCPFRAAVGCFILLH